MDLEKQIRIIKKGTSEIIPEENLVKKLKKSEAKNTPLRIKYGIDPTGSEVHIGHLVPIRKMREFQDLGHIGVIIIGDFTARIGDPTGRDLSRPPLTAEQVRENASRYMEQLYTVLDKDKTEVRWQTEWFGSMGMAEVLKLLGNFTIAQFMAHDTFRRRFEQNLPLGMHEIMYPVLQGYDSVAVKADIELGATEQKFNILCGRDMQRYHGMEEQIAILSPILMGTCGREKMSKSLNNYIAVFDEPNDKYGKVMSIPDDLIINYFNYATKTDPDEIAEIEKNLNTGAAHPKKIKQLLARRIVELYHGEKEALLAEDAFEKVFAQKEIPEDISEIFIAEKTWLVKLLTEQKLCSSNGDARRQIQQNAVSINGEKMTDPDFELEPGKTYVIKVGKRRFLKVSRG